MGEETLTSQHLISSDAYIMFCLVIPSICFSCTEDALIFLAKREGNASRLCHGTLTNIVMLPLLTQKSFTSSLSNHKVISLCDSQFLLLLIFVAIRAIT